MNRLLHLPLHPILQQLPSFAPVCCSSETKYLAQSQRSLNPMRSLTSHESLSSCQTHAERTLALLAFPDASTSPVADLMDVSHRQKTASRLNAVILKVQDQVGPSACLRLGCRVAKPRGTPCEHSSTNQMIVIPGSLDGDCGSSVRLRGTGYSAQIVGVEREDSWKLL